MEFRSWRARGRGILLVFALTGVAFAETSAPPAAPPADLEDRQGWSADKKVDEATKRAADLKAQAHLRKDEPCPALADWDKWFQDTLDLEASWVAMRDVRDKVRRSGAGGEKVTPFREAFGSAAAPPVLPAERSTRPRASSRSLASQREAPLLKRAARRGSTKAAVATSDA